MFASQFAQNNDKKRLFLYWNIFFVLFIFIPNIRFIRSSITFLLFTLLHDRLSQKSGA